jgi:Holliday junction resolvasome RuvABC ATP-dependent DNA helicase subunit
VGAKTVKLSLAPFTWWGPPPARAAHLGAARPVRDTERLDYYESEDLKKIALRSARILDAAWL